MGICTQAPEGFLLWWLVALSSETEGAVNNIGNTTNLIKLDTFYKNIKGIEGAVDSRLGFEQGETG